MGKNNAGVENNATRVRRPSIKGVLSESNIRN